MLDDTLTQAYSTVTRKGQTTIPAEVRDRIGLKAGDRLTYKVCGEGEFTVRVEPGVSSLLGIGSQYAKRKGTASFKAEQEAGEEAWARDAITDRTPGAS
jgi:AbrB family looped-hinge helix DNA binding protein